MTTYLIAAIGMVDRPSAIHLTFAKTIDSIRAIALAPAPQGSQIVVSTEEGGVRIMDTKTMSTVRDLTKHLQAAYGLAWSSDGKTIASGDETARIFLETTGGKKTREYRTHTRGIQKLSFSPDCMRILSTGKDDVVKIYDLHRPAPRELDQVLGAGANFYGATFNPHAGSFLTGTLDVGARVYDSGTLKVKQYLTGHSGQGVLDVAYNPAGSRAATAGKDGTVLVWDLASGKKVGTIRGHQDWVTAVTFSPNGKVIATSSTDGTVRVWDAYSLQAIGKIDGQSSIGSPICFSADGATLVSVNTSGGVEFNKLNPPQAGTPAPPAKPVKKKPVKKHK